MLPFRRRPDFALDPRLWEGVDRLVDRAPTAADLRSHRIEPIAARRLRARGLEVPEEVLAAERTAAVASLAGAGAARARARRLRGAAPRPQGA